MMNPMSLERKRILILGESTGIDKAVENTVIDLGGEITHVVVENGVNSICDNVTNIVKDGGPFDGIVFSIVHSDFKPLQFVKPENVTRIIEDNFGIFVELMRSLKKAKGLKDGASIVAMSSISSIRAMKAKMAFCAAKAALDAAVRCLAVELASSGIRINTIQKGFVDTDFEKEHIQNVAAINHETMKEKMLLKVTKAWEIANLIAFLLSDATITITGTSIVIDGGYIL